MTRITIDLTDKQVAAVRSNWSHLSSAKDSASQVLAAVYEALPPVPIEPKAGGTCKAKGYLGGDAARILLAGDDWLVVQWDNHIPQVWTSSQFESVFEVLS